MTETPDPDRDIPHRMITPPVLYVGTPVARIATLNPDGSPNITPISSAWALGDRVVLGMSTGGQGSENAVREGECEINFPSASLWQKGGADRPNHRPPSGPAYEVARGYYHEPHKFGAAGLTPLPSNLVRPPRIVAAHAPGRGAVADRSPRDFAVIETRVDRIHAHENITISGTDHIDVSAWQPLLYVFRH